MTIRWTGRDPNEPTQVLWWYEFAFLLKYLILQQNSKLYAPMNSQSSHSSKALSKNMLYSDFCTTGGQCAKTMHVLSGHDCNCIYQVLSICKSFAELHVCFGVLTIKSCWYNIQECWSIKNLLKSFCYEEQRFPNCGSHKATWLLQYITQCSPMTMTLVYWFTCLSTFLLCPMMLCTNYGTNFWFRVNKRTVARKSEPL